MSNDPQLISRKDRGYDLVTNPLELDQHGLVIFILACDSSKRIDRIPTMGSCKHLNVKVGC